MVNWFRTSVGMTADACGMWRIKAKRGSQIQGVKPISPKTKSPPQTRLQTAHICRRLPAFLLMQRLDVAHFARAKFFCRIFVGIRGLFWGSSSGRYRDNFQSAPGFFLQFPENPRASLLRLHLSGYALWTAPSEKDVGRAALAVCLRHGGPVPLDLNTKSLKTAKTGRRCLSHRDFRVSLSRH